MYVDTGDLGRDLATVLNRRPSEAFLMARDHVTPAFIAYSATHPEFGRAWRHRVMEPGRQCLKRILERGIERGQLPADLDLELSMALLLGPMLDGTFSRWAAARQTTTSAGKPRKRFAGRLSAGVECSEHLRTCPAVS